LMRVQRPNNQLRPGCRFRRWHLPVAMVEMHILALVRNRDRKHHRARCSTCTRFGSILTISGERDARR
jgi:hypothetical protein